MTLPNRLTQTLDFQAQALVLRSERQRVLASNIANADTPGYVAREMDFGKALSEATRHLPAGVEGSRLSSGAASPLTAARAAATQPGHMGLPGLGPQGSTLSYALASQNSVDRNSVDMDRERASFADNSVRYEAALRFINGGVRTMLDAMKPYNQ